MIDSVQETWAEINYNNFCKTMSSKTLKKLIGHNVIPGTKDLQDTVQHKPVLRILQDTVD